MTDDDREALTAYLDGELDSSAEQVVETRLSHDPKLRAELDALKETWGMLDFLPKASPSSDFTHRTLDKLTLENRGKTTVGRGRWTFRRATMWLACALVALGIGLSSSASYRKFLEKPIDSDEPVIRNLRLLERLPAYETVDDLGFLKTLDDPDLFGDEGM